jgi:hypothetical protein
MVSSLTAVATLSLTRALPGSSDDGVTRVTERRMPTDRGPMTMHGVEQVTTAAQAGPRNRPVDRGPLGANNNAAAGSSIRPVVVAAETHEHPRALIATLRPTAATATDAERWTGENPRDRIAALTQDQTAIPSHTVPTDRGPLTGLK